MSPVIAPLESLPAPAQDEFRTAEAVPDLVVVREDSKELDFVDPRSPRRWTDAGS